MAFTPRRRLWVEPEGEKNFTGRVAAMGYTGDNSINHKEPSKSKPLPMRPTSGEPALIDTVPINGSSGTLLELCYKPTRSKVYLFSDLVAVRKPAVDKHYRGAIWKMEHVSIKMPGFSSRTLEWDPSLFLLMER